MSDVSITPANVIPGNGAKTRPGVAGATIVAGKAVVVDPATDKVVLADSNHATAALRVAKGISLNGASDGQPIEYQIEGPITIGGTLTPGAAYYLSDTPGGICPVADVGSGERAVLLGMAISASELDLDIQDSGVAL